MRWCRATQRICTERKLNRCVLTATLVGVTVNTWLRQISHSFSCAMDPKSRDIHSLLCNVLLDAEGNGLNDILGQEFVRSLLSDEEPPAEGEDRERARQHQTWGPVLDRPYTTCLSQALEHCVREGCFRRPPFPQNAELSSLLVEDAEEIELWQQSVRCWSGSEQSLVSALSCLGRFGIRLALGQRRTHGSCDALPPSRQELVRAFSAPHNDGGDTSQSHLAQEHTAHHAAHCCFHLSSCGTEVILIASFQI